MAKGSGGVSVYLDSKKTQQVLSKLEHIDEQSLPTELKALLAGSQTVVNSAKRRVPKKTGTLSRSIHAEVESDGVLVGTDVSYAKYVEQGTARMKGRPYLQPALTENTTRIQNQVAKAIQQMLASQGE
nr:MAG TPA: putative tail component [Caudoviricetes sp.]